MVIFMALVLIYLAIDEYINYKPGKRKRITFLTLTIFLGLC